MKSKKQKQELDIEVELQKLGARIKQLRLANGHTNMEVFAFEHGIGRTQYGRYEKGKDLQYSTLIRVFKCIKYKRD